ncbi:nitrous oxide reductase accessory protein NosL [Sinisalibacter aestuarii]|uniref:Nitrous oxide reductase accessory protein NosL n=1 Tax=Sinisalibacter aestuarii TaxID=2949426 RepID=A0ABQ5LX41_9RHOB|nr:nitrous oxide reductase accessory protein NosL [Sinisalibacter aestuarii]GKY89547.1 nitrous oxide reductase accessory protein NosL [Sinisalibacter aestuarii]
MCDHHAPRPAFRADRRRLLATLPAAALLAGLGLPPAHADAGPVELPRPGPRDTCPVCGMFVAQYPEWVATVLWNDGEAAHFDGAKDFFKYLADLEKYAPGRTTDQIAGMGVTEYYGLTLVDARHAQYVIGSDVYGPMGHELVPMMTDVDATDFMRDHSGKRRLRFGEVDLPLLTGLDEGRFE